MYWRIYRRCKRLAALGYVRLDRRVDWQATNDLRMQIVNDSIHDIFRAAVTPPGTLSTGTPSTEAKPEISTAKVMETGFTVVPTGQLLYLLNRMQNSNQFFDPAKSRREMSEIRSRVDQQKVQRRRRCPYYLSARTKWIRIEAVFRLRSIRRHAYFRRRDKKVVNAELLRDLDIVQGQFGKYSDEVRGLKCALIHKETGSIKLLDYQTRFTDENRKDQVIARYHKAWKKAGESYNTAVFLTRTSYPPTEAPKNLYRQSLWNVDRHFPVASNAYWSKLEKRNRAARRDELLDAMREQVGKIRPVTETRERCWHCRGTGKIDYKNESKKTCKKCGGLGYRLRVKLTRSERQKALEPLKIDYHILKKAGEIRKENRLILTDEEYQECEDRINFRPIYIDVNEFMKNGLLHDHCVIFGVHYLDNFEQIKTDWQLTGQGERVHIYALHREGDVWVWSKAAPADARNRQPVDYLGKYLVKGVKQAGNHGMYWSVNKRFFTNSRRLTDDWVIPEALEDVPAVYQYFRSVRADGMPNAFILEQLEMERPAPGSRGTGRPGGGGGWLDPLGWGKSPVVPA